MAPLPQSPPTASAATMFSHPTPPNAPLLYNPTPREHYMSKQIIRSLLKGGPGEVMSRRQIATNYCISVLRVSRICRQDEPWRGYHWRVDGSRVQDQQLAITTTQHIDKFDIDGNFIARYTVDEVARDACCTRARVCQVTNRTLPWHGYMWRMFYPTLPNEEWEFHPALNVLISTCGRIKHDRGPPTWGLTKDAEERHLLRFAVKYKVDRVVMETFIGFYPGKRIDHINGDVSDNNLSNLKYIG